MQNLTFDSIKQASSALNIEEVFITAARGEGCLAFVHGRIRAGLLLDFMEKEPELRGINNRRAESWYSWEGKKAPCLTRQRVANARALLAKLSAQVTPQKRHRGREIAAAVKRELGAKLACRLAKMTPEAAALELHQVRDRILAL